MDLRIYNPRIRVFLDEHPGRRSVKVVLVGCAPEEARRIQEYYLLRSLAIGFHVCDMEGLYDVLSCLQAV